ncbi:nodulation protein NfeD [Sporosarcina sp. E16_8]|uniref:NfeD family protein n=1 Tax=Sporosarcina sp. E16_8 TaxID=2789295 RepID=UPI001A930B35|nr:nodulation protein NfeD [Sporosarcina sp. E16_8]MBO0587750.1 nodulation protein NfeD [Sporosarcina sp. E16_8]
MHKMIGRIILFILFVSAFAFPLLETGAATSKVYKVPVEDVVEKGLYAFLQRSFEEAEEAGAKAIILEINTPGGFTDAADQIAKLMDESPLRVIAYINNKAISAGAFIALYADEIYMSPTATMGAAQVIDSAGNAADVKAHSVWVADMITAAESKKGREPKYAEAMADPEINLPDYRAGVGKLLTLKADEAKKVGYSNETVESFNELLKITGLENADIISTKETFAESIARFVTHPIVVPILLSIAGLGFVLELYSPGFGVPGTMAGISLVLFFYGHLVAGLAGYETIILFLIGAGLVVAEIFLPHGIAGVIGSLAIIGSIIMAGGNPMYMAISVLIAVAIAVIGMVIIMKFFGKKLHLLNKVVLMDTTDTESGYVSNVNRIELLGRIAKTSTPLRPSGAIELDGERIDVVSEGSYIGKGISVIIVKVEGSRTVVRESKEKGENE